VHEVIHTFTHFEKKFLLTVKQLACQPGTLQKKYLAGHRAKPQKPFAFFVVCATICGLAMYFIHKNSPTGDDYFYKHYWLFIHAAMLPFYSFVTWIFFKSSKLYYAEALVLTIYMLGFMLLMIIPVNLLYFFSNDGVVSICEIIFLTFYTVFTNLNFFNNKPKWIVIIKSIICIVFNYVVLNEVSNILKEWIE
jgi:hypothetical protein